MSRPPEPIDVAVARWAARANPRLLGILAGLGASGAAALALWERWPVAAALGAVASFGLWGLLEHSGPRPHSRPVRVAQRLTLLLGALAATTGALGFLFWALGPAPTF